jgi:hypothetical protein
VFLDVFVVVVVGGARKLFPPLPAALRVVVVDLLVLLVVVAVFACKAGLPEGFLFLSLVSDATNAGRGCVKTQNHCLCT